MTIIRHATNVAIGLMIVVSPLLGQNTGTGGGGGGTTYNIKCASNEVLTGIRVSYGFWIDRITPSCADATSVMGYLDNYHQLTSSAGTSHFGNTEKSFGCPANYAVKSFTGAAGTYVHSLIITCHKLGRSWRTTSTTKELAQAGASGGSTFSRKACTEEMPAVGIQGKDGQYVDSFGLICGYIMPTKPVLQAPINGLRVTTKRPTFYFTSGLYTTGHSICVNLTSTANCSAPNTVKFDFTQLAPTTWTPAADLPYSSGVIVYWSVNSCNDTGCKSSVGNFAAR